MSIFALGSWDEFKKAELLVKENELSIGLKLVNTASYTRVMFAGNPSLEYVVTMAESTATRNKQLLMELPAEVAQALRFLNERVIKETENKQELLIHYRQPAKRPGHPWARSGPCGKAKKEAEQHTRAPRHSSCVVAHWDSFPRHTKHTTTSDICV